MRRLTLVVAVICILASTIPLSAGLVTYTNRGLFEAALGSYTIDPMNYGTVGTIASGAVVGLNFYDFLVQTTPNALKIIAGSDGYGAFDTTGDAQAKFLYLDTDIGFQGSATTFTMHSPTLGFGFDYTGVTQAGGTFTAAVLGSTFNLAFNPLPPGGGPSTTPLFWGVISTAPFDQIVLTTSNDSGYGVDQVTFGGTAIPEPSTFALMGLGIAVVLFVRRAPTYRG